MDFETGGLKIHKGFFFVQLCVLPITISKIQGFLRGALRGEEGKFHTKKTKIRRFTKVFLFGPFHVAYGIISKTQALLAGALGGEEGMFHTKKTKIRRFTKDSKVYKGSYYNHNSFHIASIPLRYPVDCNDRRGIGIDA